MLNVVRPTKSDVILIKKLKTIEANKKNEKCQQNLKENVFDPTNASPPNEFMIKLYSRMNKFEKKN
jgi:hypothetical protein